MDKTPKEYKCEMCNFYTTVKCNYERHLNTKKHLSKDIIPMEVDENTLGKVKTLKEEKLSVDLEEINIIEPKINKKAIKITIYINLE